MSVTIAQVKAAIAAALGTVGGIQRIYQTAPNSLPPSDLPAVVIYTGVGRYEERGYNLSGEMRQYLLRLYIAPMQQGVSGEVETTAQGFIPLVRAVFPHGDRLGRLAGLLEARLTGDQGVSMLVLGGSAYLGVEFALEVVQ